jgi:diacylglycerol O-acyltransferase / wax synthase
MASVRLSDSVRLSHLDTAFLRLDSPGAPMHLGALAIFQPARPIAAGRLLDLLGERVERLPALRWRAEGTLLPPGGHRWVPDRRFEPRGHVHPHRLRGADRAEVAALAARTMAEPLDLDRPLWELHLVTGLHRGAFAVLLKMHHALADGLRAVELGLGLLDGFADGPVASAAVPPAPGLLDTLRAMASPWRLLTDLPAAARQAAGAAGIAASVLSNVRPTVPASPLTAQTPEQRHLVLLRLDLAGVREVRGRHGGTDHDVLLTVLSSALRTWVGQTDAELRALIPVSRRRRRGETGYGNVLSGYLCPLPVRETDPVARLHAVRTSMGNAKAAGPGRGAGAFPLLAEMIPEAAYRAVAPLARHGARRLFDTVVTNVPVPNLELTLRGAPLREVYPITPLAPGHALGIALSTHRRTVHIGLHANGPTVPDLDRLTQAIPAALEALRTADRPAVSSAA